jgi:hypothetical protein
MESPRKSLFNGLLYFGKDGGKPILEAALTIEGATSAEARTKGSIIVYEWLRSDGVI